MNADSRSALELARGNIHYDSQPGVESSFVKGRMGFVLVRGQQPRLCQDFHSSLLLWRCPLSLRSIYLGCTGTTLCGQHCFLVLYLSLWHTSGVRGENSHLPRADPELYSQYRILCTAMNGCQVRTHDQLSKSISNTEALPRLWLISKAMITFFIYSFEWNHCPDE